MTNFNHRPMAWPAPDPTRRVGNARRDRVQRSWSEDERHQAVVLVVEGYNLYEVAEILGRTYSSVQKYFSSSLRLKASKLHGARRWTGVTK